MDRGQVMLKAKPLTTVEVVLGGGVLAARGEGEDMDEERSVGRAQAVRRF